jgi:uncharacterized protein YndB with AHSA1/START domain
MERKTKVDAEPGKQDILITREFDLPVELLFKAHVDPEIVEQWMGSKALKLEGRKHGGWHLQKRDEHGNVLFEAEGVFHEFVEDQKITRTFEMANGSFGVQLEFLEFSKLSDDTSKLIMHIVYKSSSIREQVLKLPFVQGINMAHNQLQNVLSRQK